MFMEKELIPSIHVRVQNPMKIDDGGWGESNFAEIRPTGRSDIGQIYKLNQASEP
jgi:hypothetical protein